MKKVSIIVPYKEDRGWLQHAVNSVPCGVQLILSQGEGCWPENFNKALSQATGDYIKWLHEDDMLTDNCIEDSLRAFAELDVDFIHGKAFELDKTGNVKVWEPLHKTPTLDDLLRNNCIHSTTLMYKKEVFEKIGGLNVSPYIYSFEEFEFNLRCLSHGLKIGYVNTPLAFYRRHPKQIIRTVNGIERRKNRNDLLNTYIHGNTKHG